MLLILIMLTISLFVALFFLHKAHLLNASLQAHLLSERAAFADKLQAIQSAEAQLKESFKVLSMEVLEKSSENFLSVATKNLEKLHLAADHKLEKREETISRMIKPVNEAIEKLDKGIVQLEKERKNESVQLKGQIDQLVKSERELLTETQNLVSALRKPDVRGMWGEMQLRRVVEVAGMVSYCDFSEQNSVTHEEGRLRPDMIIHLPGNKNVIVDAKAPLDAFLTANQTDKPEERQDRLKAHARHLKQHIAMLGKKSYHQHFEETPEFVILFLPSEIFFSAAMEVDPSLIEVGAAQNVILATPTTLIGLLKAIAYGWKQDKLSQNARQISELGHDLYKRLSDMTKHWTSLGKTLSNAVDHYNKAMGSYERRVLVSARRFKEFGSASDEIELDAIELIDTIPKIAKLEESSENS